MLTTSLDKPKPQQRKRFKCKVCSDVIWLEPLDMLYFGTNPEWVAHNDCIGNVG